MLRTFMTLAPKSIHSWMKRQASHVRNAGTDTVEHREPRRSDRGLLVRQRCGTMAVLSEKCPRAQRQAVLVHVVAAPC